MPIPCLYRTRVAHASGQSPENFSWEAMGHARAWEATQRIIADTHTKSEREGKIKEWMSTEEKQLSSGSKWHEDLFPPGKVLFTMATKGEDPHSGFFPLWRPVKRCAYLVVELTARSPIRRGIGRYNKHTNMQRKTTWANSSQPNSIFKERSQILKRTSTMKYKRQGEKTEQSNSKEIEISQRTELNLQK